MSDTVPPPRIALMLDFDGTAYVGDLPVQAYARRLAEQLPEPAGVALIAGARRFLERREVPGDPGTDLSAAEDGYQAVELLAVAAGLDAGQISAGYRASRHDLAASAFALDPVEGLAALLHELGSLAVVKVISNADATGVHEVLDGVGLTPWLDEVIVDAGKPDCWPDLLRRTIDLVGSARRIMAVGDRWNGDLAAVAAAGGWTALIDRFDRRDGTPDVTGPDLAGLLPELRKHALRLLGQP